MPENVAQQLFFMRWAIQLGEKGRITAPPNPWVGCVLVKEGEILAEGYHQAPGHLHAEQIALQKAGACAKGCTAYISLEPCSHHGKTPPCAQALITAGVKKVLIPFLDPDPQVAGRGVQALEKAGILVEIGLAKEEAEQSLLPYLHHRRTKRPFCVLKAGISLDGKTAAADGTSQWITSKEARHDVQLLRAQSQAILIGSQTALHDQPRLTVRLNTPFTPPLRVLIDSKGQVPPEGPLFDPSLAPTLVFTSHPTWNKPGIEVVRLSQITLEKVLQELGCRNVMQLLIEGGANLQTAFIKEKWGNQLTLYIGDCLLGSRGQPLFNDHSIETLTQAPRLQLINTKRFGQSVRLDYFLTHLTQKITL